MGKSQESAFLCIPIKKHPPLNSLTNGKLVSIFLLSQFHSIRTAQIIKMEKIHIKDGISDLCIRPGYDVNTSIVW